MRAEICNRKLTAAVLAAGLLVAEPPAALAGPFFDNPPPQGWFWYSLLPEPPPEPQPEPKPPMTAKERAAPAKTTTAPPGSAVFSAAWLREHLPKYRNRAIDRPTRENVLAYMFLQRLVMDKSQRFADAVQSVVKTTPVLDASTRRPISSLGARLANRRAEQARDRIMTKLADRLGVWFFYSGAERCAYCAAQAGILQGFTEIHGIPVTAIALDGSPPPTGFDEAKVDRGQARRLRITTPLALVLVNPATREVIPLAHGLLTRDQLVARIVLAAHTAGWLSDNAYNRTRPMRADDLLAPRDNPGETTPAADTSALPISPAEILRHLRIKPATRLPEDGDE
ncbi:MAG: conjugal transfer protein TraF [Nitrococcus mobilis]|nr:conjugal transfer protein TraF [Nitrococcus mobilis]